MSWFSGAALPLSLGDTLNGLKDKVQAKVNSIDPDLIKKLTLQSDELFAERQQIEDEERRKEAVRDSLSEILPWETRDVEMEILVDECREVILGLSSKNETFTGPFVLEGGLGAEGGNGDDEDGQMAKDVAAAETSAEKLSKLQPLPALLASFDLDTHVGLIQRLLTEDPKLVYMQSRLSSGGERELVFWKNYFFHCAYTRYEAGLSIDEIWSNEPRASRPSVAVAVAAAAAVEEESEGFDLVNGEESENEVVFDSPGGYEGSSDELESETAQDIDVGVANHAQPMNQLKATIQQTSTPSKPSLPSASPFRQSDTSQSVTNSQPPESGGGADYEFVASGMSDGDDGSIDELEAEIAAALDD